MKNSCRDRIYDPDPGRDHDLDPIPVPENLDFVKQMKIFVDFEERVFSEHENKVLDAFPNKYFEVFHMLLVFFRGFR